MNFLVKFAAILLRATSIVTGLSPLIPPAASVAVSRIESELVQLAGVITSVEAIGQVLTIPGADKAKAAGPLVAQVVLQSALMVNKKIADPVKFAAACQALGGDFADLLSSLHESAVQIQDKA